MERSGTCALNTRINLEQLKMFGTYTQWWSDTFSLWIQTLYKRSLSTSPGILSRLSWILLVRRPQTQRVDRSHIKLRIPTFLQTLCGCQERSPTNLRRRRYGVDTSDKRQGEKVGKRDQIQQSQEYQSADSATIWHVNFQNYPTTS